MSPTWGTSDGIRFSRKTSSASGPGVPLVRLTRFVVEEEGRKSHDEGLPGGG